MVKLFTGQSFKLSGESVASTAPIDVSDDEGAAEQLAAVAQFARDELCARVASNCKQVHDMVCVAEGWVIELGQPNKYTKDALEETNTFIGNAKAVLETWSDLAEAETLGLQPQELINQNVLVTKNMMMEWQRLKDDVDFLCGRANQVVRKLKREGSDMSASSNRAVKKKYRTDSDYDDEDTQEWPETQVH